jgi:hypothetical protein
MSYFVTCNFDLKNASRTDYDNAYADLKTLGLSRTVTGQDGKEITLPTTTVAGTFNGVSAVTVRDDLAAKVRAAFERRRFSSEIFITVGGDWTWQHQTT